MYRVISQNSLQPDFISHLATPQHSNHKPLTMEHASLGRYGEEELVGGQFLAVLTGCARGLKIPLTADSRFPPNSYFEKTQLLLIWELGVHL
jgi:hypothetical protein